jgi:hypothetical protein
MNIDIWFLFKQFWGFSIADKIIAVAGFVLIILLIILWEVVKAERHDTKRLSTATPYLIIKSAEKHIHTTSTYSNNGNLRKHHSRGVIRCYLLETFRNSLRKHHVYYETDNNGDSPTHTVQRHISTIVNKLRRRVNQSGKEPYT